MKHEWPKQENKRWKSESKEKAQKVRLLQEGKRQMPISMLVLRNVGV
tara:strand:- start:2030 stop:2170 length:141 start_codon:yes stop_codon:yes gene_type:complete